MFLFEEYKITFFFFIRTNLRICSKLYFQGKGELLVQSRENKGIEKDYQSVGWDMSVSPDVCIAYSLFPTVNSPYRKKYHFLSFTKSFSSTKLFSPLSAILLRSLRTSD